MSFEFTANLNQVMYCKLPLWIYRFEITIFYHWFYYKPATYCMKWRILVFVRGWNIKYLIKFTQIAVLSPKKLSNKKYWRDSKSIFMAIYLFLQSKKSEKRWRIGLHLLFMMGSIYFYMYHIIFKNVSSLFNHYSLGKISFRSGLLF